MNIYKAALIAVMATGVGLSAAMLAAFYAVVTFMLNAMVYV